MYYKPQDIRFIFAFDPEKKKYFEQSVEIKVLPSHDVDSNNTESTTTAYCPCCE